MIGFKVSEKHISESRRSMWGGIAPNTELSLERPTEMISQSRKDGFSPLQEIGIDCAERVDSERINKSGTAELWLYSLRLLIKTGTFLLEFLQNICHADTLKAKIFWFKEIWTNEKLRKIPKTVF